MDDTSRDGAQPKRQRIPASHTQQQSHPAPIEMTQQWPSQASLKCQGAADIAGAVSVQPSWSMTELDAWRRQAFGAAAAQVSRERQAEVRRALIRPPEAFPPSKHKS